MSMTNAERDLLLAIARAELARLGRNPTHQMPSEHADAIAKALRAAFNDEIAVTDEPVPEK